MVKYNHCEKCKSVYNTTPWIGEVHAYDGICPSCMTGEQQINQVQQEITDDHLVEKHDTKQTERIQSSPLEIERRLLSSLEQKANEVLSGTGSIFVLIKEIKDDLVDKAMVRIGETYKSFEVNKIEAQKVIDYAENSLDCLSEYEDYVDCMVKKLQDNPKMKVKTAIDKVFKESISNLPKTLSKEDFLRKKVILKRMSDKAIKLYNFYSDTSDTPELIKKMGLHPFSEIKEKLSTLPFYASN